MMCKSMNQSSRASLSRSALLLCVLVAGSTSSVAFGQDSVASTPGLPGDAVNAYQTSGTGGSEQVNNFVVDLSIKRSSWGQRYLIGPVAKSSLSSQPTLWYNHLIASTVVSSKFSDSDVFPRTTYAAWNTPGQGINGQRNSTPSGTGRFGTQNTSNLFGQTFGLAFLEFAAGPNAAFGDTDDENNIVSSLVTFQPRFNDRLYVSRIVGVTNKTASANGNATLGLGSVDDSGNLHFVADGFGMTGGNVVTNKKYFRVDSLLRNAANANLLGDSGGGDSVATRQLYNVSTTLSTPSIIPESVATRPVLVSLDLANNQQLESVANTTTITTTHLDAGVSARGTASVVPMVFGPLNPSSTTVALGGALSRGASQTKTRGISVWGMTATGLPTARLRLEMPTVGGAMIDRDDNFDPSAPFGSLGNQEFTNYASQAVFRGANGPVAMTVLPNGDLLAAATVTATGNAGAVPASLNNYIAVVRRSATSTTPIWTIAAHTGNANGSAGGLAKAIYGDFGADGIPGNADAGEGDNLVDATPIGSLALLSETYPSVPSGPSISAPAIDALGNVYFMAAISLNGAPNPNPTVRHSVGLLRANFNSSTNSYRLELLADIGDVVAGRNSSRNYQIQFISVADADSIDSGTIWSSSVVPDTLEGINTSLLPYASPLSLGALTFRARIVYDTNNDGNFIDPTQPGGTGTDEAYNVAMVMQPYRPIADIGAQGGLVVPDGQYDNNDFAAFVTAFFDGDFLTADIGSQGGIIGSDESLDNNDFVAFIAAFFANQ